VLRTGATLVPPFDDPDVIEGQGTVGLELAEQMANQAGGPPAMVIVPCGGGGLAAGIALALPAARVVAVEPDGWDDMGASLARGEPVPVPAGAPATICDALLTRQVSQLTLDVLRERGAVALSVSDQEVARAIAFAARRLRLVVEPGGAVALAALLAGKVRSVPELTAVVLSGGNVDPKLYAGIIEDQAAEVIR